jgi:hypothetical protein
VSTTRTARAAGRPRRGTARVSGSPGAASGSALASAAARWPVSAIFVAIKGPTGVGKTTLTARFATVLDAEAVLDPFKANPFLAPLHEPMSRSAASTSSRLAKPSAGPISSARQSSAFAA